jgi:fructokinase
MNPKKHLVVGIGEVLWDVLPTGKQPGGAPANFAYFASALGDCGAIVSRIGRDRDGREIVERLTQLGVSTDVIQLDDTHATGTVDVEMDAAGQPRYSIREQAAWDYLEWSAELEGLAARADGVCWGTLAQRTDRTRDTIMRFIKATRRDALRVFDVNLRQSFFSSEVIAGSIQQANIIKLNHEELPRVLSTLGLRGRKRRKRHKRKSC